jgi:membrane fusion protein (multidrug efflux system)
VSIDVDAYGGREFAGMVDSIAAATGSRFSLLPPENATGNFVKVVQRVPVKIVLARRPGPEPPPPARHVGDTHGLHTIGQA